MHQIAVGNVIEARIGQTYHKCIIRAEIPTVTELPPYLKNRVDKEGVAIMYRIKFLYPDRLESWEKINGVPITLRTSGVWFKSINSFLEVIRLRS